MPTLKQATTKKGGLTMVVVTKLIVLGIACVCAVTLALIVLEFVEDKVKSKYSKNRNHVKFYVARDKDGSLWLYMGKPKRSVNEFESANEYCVILTDYDFTSFGLNQDDFKDLKWEDEPVEVFVNMED